MKRRRINDYGYSQREEQEGAMLEVYQARD